MTTSTLTPPQYAKKLGISPDKVLAWIRSGELRAINVAAKPGGRPRWRISEAAIEAFEARRSATPPTKPVRRRRRNPADVIEYF